MSANSCNRVFYAVQQISIANCSSPTALTLLKGAQSVGFSGDIPFESIRQLGCVEDYQQVEDTPEVELTIDKVFDGSTPIFLLAAEVENAETDSGGVDLLEPTLVGRSTQSANIVLSIFDAEQDCAEGAADCFFLFKEMWPSSISYNFSTDGPFTESVTFQGHNVLSSNQTGGIYAITSTADIASINQFAGLAAVSGQFGTVANRAPDAGEYVNMKEHIIFDKVGTLQGDTLDVNGYAADPDRTVLPIILEGISASGTNEKSGNDYSACIQSISVSADLPRENIECLGTRNNRCKFVDFPVDVTCEIEQLTQDCGRISLSESGIFTTALTGACANNFNNTKDSTIRIATCDGTRIYLGTKNRLQSWNYGGGDVDGGSATISYTFRNSSVFTMLHENFTTESSKWSARSTWLSDV